MCVSLITGTALFNSWLRALGAKVGKQAWIGEVSELWGFQPPQHHGWGSHIETRTHQWVSLTCGPESCLCVNTRLLLLVTRLGLCLLLLLTSCTRWGLVAQDLHLTHHELVEIGDTVSICR